MQALIVDNFRIATFGVVEISRPEPVLVRIKAIGVNPFDGKILLRQSNLMKFFNLYGRDVPNRPVLRRLLLVGLHSF